MFTMFTKMGLFYVLCNSLTFALCSDWLRLYNQLSSSSLTLIESMGGPITDDECRVPFPYKLYSSAANSEVESHKLVFIRDTLKLILDLYRHDNISSAGWDTTKTDHFLISIDRQIDELNSCVSTQRVNRELRRYFRKLRMNTLQSMDGSAASWELLRQQTKLHLQQLDLVVASIKARRGRSTTTRRQC
ncbi:interferon phi 1 [Mugil cephalus]|uniref:interferon phi 1 n=1 Tax=Mugil cephalus TaxID=48193 RepID=UPI001FB7439D|nr:interferon phi 1 [Mugil cephalus]